MERRELRHDRHTVSLLTGHTVFSPKYRGKILAGVVALALDGIIRKTCEDLNIEIIDMAVNVDHVYLFIKYPPKYSVSYIAKRIKGRSSSELRKAFSHLKEWCGKSIWASSCFHGSVGHGWEVVESCIQNQEKPNAKSLNPERLPEGFDAEIHGEKPIAKVEESKGRSVVSYTFPGFYLSEDVLDVEGKKISFKQGNIAATGFLAESGKPLLPSFGRYVQIPFNCDYKFTVEKGKPVQFDDMLVSPAQEKLTDNPKEKHILEYDKEVYAKDALYSRRDR